MELTKDFYTYRDNFEGLTPGYLQQAEGLCAPQGGKEVRCGKLGPMGAYCTRSTDHEGEHIAHTDEETDDGFKVVAVFTRDYEATEEDKQSREHMDFIDFLRFMTNQ